MANTGANDDFIELSDVQEQALISAVTTSLSKAVNCCASLVAIFWVWP